MKGFPPVSAMCLTYGRPHLLEEAIQSFLLQDYPGSKELVVLNDFADQILVCDHINVRIINTGERFATVGEKRNACAELATHDILFVWDDDDIHLPWRISLSIDRLDESKGFYKSPHAWMISDGQLQGPTTNLYHSAACFTRELFERAGRYPHIGSGQDWGLEEEFKNLIPDGKDDFSLTMEQLYYIYRWRGTGSYHLSAFGRDEGKAIKGNQRVAEFVNSQVAAGKIRTGMVRLKPVWRTDYLALVQSRISDPSGAPVAVGNSLQQPLNETEAVEEEVVVRQRSKPAGVPTEKQSVTASPSNGSPSNNGISATGAWNVPLQKWHQHDPGLANALAEFFRGASVIDFGCGPGLYVQRINETATCRGYDGNPHAGQVKNCQVLDLSERVDIPPGDWVLSLEVGEHLPRRFESTFIDNLHRHNRCGIVLSWATPGQGGIGHFNERPIDYIAQCFENLGYERDRAQENVFRNASTKRYFRKNILVLRRASETLTQRARQAASGAAGGESLPLISCIMPTYGRPEFVHESLAMFLAQDYENKELLIVNDCPRQEFQCDLPQVRIINCDQRYQSLGEKRNFAISQAQGDWLAVWDDDDIYLPWRLSFSMQEILEFETPLYRPLTYWAYWGQQQLHENQATPGWISHPLMIFHRELWEKSGDTRTLR